MAEVPSTTRSTVVGGVARWATPLVIVAAVVAILAALTDWAPAVQIALAALVGAGAAVWLARSLAMPLVLLGVLTWSGFKSEIDPGLLWTNRHQASEYVFGRSLSDQETSDVQARAERLVEMRLTFDAEQSVLNELQLDPGEDRPDNFVDQVQAKRLEIAASLSEAEWQARIDREAARLTSDRRGGYFPPETDPKALKGYADALLETVAIAIWGTVGAVVLAVPIAMLGSQRTLNVIAPGGGWFHEALRRVGCFFTRRGFDACRGFNEFVLALIFVAVLGLGPFAGVLALAVHTFGVLGKVFSDAMESARKGEIEGVIATGAGPFQAVSFAVIPQIMPFLVSQSLLRFESNVRSASVLGLVGAGGIGFLIDAKIKSYQFREVATMMILLIIVVSIIDFACGRVMKRFV